MVLSCALAILALLPQQQDTPKQDGPPQKDVPQQKDDAAPAPETSPYVKALAEAATALEAHDLDAAQRALESAQLERRGFEWEHLRLGIELARAATAGPGIAAPLSQGRMQHDVAGAKVGAVSTLRGQTSSGRAVAISPSGDRIAACGLAGEVRVWSGRTGDVERLLVGHEGPVTGLAFSPDGARLVSASEDGTARVWNVADASCPFTLKGGAGVLTAIAWSPDGKHIATADASFAVRLWDSFQSQPRFALRQHSQTIHALAFSPDSRQVASASEDGSVCIFDTASGAVVHVLRTGKGGATACCFDPLGARLLVGRGDWTVRVFDLGTGDLSSTLRQKRATVESIAFTPDGRRFAIGTARGSLQVWDAVQGEQLLVLQDVGVAIHDVAFDARGTRLVVCGDDHAVHVYETEAPVARAVQRAVADELPTLEAAADMKPADVEAKCRRVVQHAGLDPALYEQAEQLAREASDRLKESGQAKTTVAGAIYRLDRSEEALAMLVEAADKKRGWPPNLAFRVMALAKLGKLEEARTWMQKLDTLLMEDRWKSDPDVRALSEEARAVLSASRSAPR